MACQSRAVVQLAATGRRRRRPARAGSSLFQPLRWTSCQMASTIAIASSLGHAAAQIFRPRPPAESRTCGISRRSSPASAAASESAAAAGPWLRCQLPWRTISSRSRSVIVAASPATSGESIRRGRRIGHRELVDDPARAAAEHDHPVAEPDRLAHVVRDEQHGEPALGADPVQLVVQQVAGHRVERAERLVHQQDLRVLGQRPGQRDPLPHAARQLVRPLVGEAAQVHQVQQVGGAAPPLGLGHPARAQRQLHVPGRGQPREQGRLLEHERDPLAAGGDLAGGGGVEPGHQVQQRALAAAGRADQADELAGGHRPATAGPGRAAPDAPRPKTLDTSLIRIPAVRCLPRS